MSYDPTGPVMAGVAMPSPDQLYFVFFYFVLTICSRPGLIPYG